MNNRIDRLEYSLNSVMKGIENITEKMESNIKGDLGNEIKNLMKINKEKRQTSIEESKEVDKEEEEDVSPLASLFQLKLQHTSKPPSPKSPIITEGKLGDIKEEDS
mmetsp:Transcript_286/g.308  ORF Transcript_286/g.308 Transcript_286/m.308 type:complete len:106 (-) Transcript_286:44-361(-)